MTSEKSCGFLSAPLAWTPTHAQLITMPTPQKSAPLSRRTLLGILCTLPLSASCLGKSSSKSETQLPNGIYPAIGDPLDAPPANLPSGQRSIRYDPKLADSASTDPVTFVTVDTKDFIPLILSKAPESQRQQDGRLLVGVALADAYVKPLADFTRAHLGQRIALLLDGEVMSCHKIRTVIEGGQIQITRCDDHACEKILSKLVKLGVGK